MAGNSFQIFLSIGFEKLQFNTLSFNHKKLVKSIDRYLIVFENSRSNKLFDFLEISANIFQSM